MKRSALLCVLALLLGAAAGLLLNVSQLSGRGLLAPSAASASAAPSAVLLNPQAVTITAADPDSNAPLLEAGSAVLAALKSGDIQTLATLVDGERGVTFTPYSTVDHHSDLTFLPDQGCYLAALTVNGDKVAVPADGVNSSQLVAAATA